MKTTALTIILAVLLVAGSTSAGVKRIDVSPAALVNLGAGHGGEFMGGAITGDIFLNNWFAMRSTLGYSKDRYYPSNADYDDASTDFWFSIAPYGEFRVFGPLRSYASIPVSFSGGGSQPARPIGMDRAPVNRLQTANDANSAWSLGGTLGAKLAVAGPVSIFAEVTHYAFTSLSRDNRTFDDGLSDVTFNYDWDRSPTWVTFGLTYSIIRGDK